MWARLEVLDCLGVRHVRVEVLVDSSTTDSVDVVL